MKEDDDDEQSEKDKQRDRQTNKLHVANVLLLSISMWSLCCLPGLMMAEYPNLLRMIILAGRYEAR